MSRKIHVNVMSKSSISNAISLLLNYQKQLEAKLEEFVTRLSNAGISVIRMTMSQVPPNDVGHYNIDMTLEHNGNEVTARINLVGDQVAFIEFSAGITYGSAPGSYPLPSGSGMGYGTYNPSSRNATNPNGWYYQVDDGVLQHTYGVAAHMPMYNADMEMRKRVEAIAQRVFRSI